MLKEKGKSKRKVYIKCDNCKERFELLDEEIIHIENFSYTECPYCSCQHILKK